MALVAIVDSIATYKRGLAAGMAEAGFSVDSSVDVAKRGHRDLDLMVISFRSEEDYVTCSRVNSIYPRLPIVGLLPISSVAAYRRAFEAGAWSAVAESATLEDIIRVMVNATNRRTVLPAEVARALATGAASEEELARFDDCEIEWLGRLAGGATVAELAAAGCCSERQMHRSLHSLYRKLGAWTRTEALVTAASSRLISHPDHHDATGQRPP